RGRGLAAPGERAPARPGKIGGRQPAPVPRGAPAAEPRQAVRLAPATAAWTAVPGPQPVRRGDPAAPPHGKAGGRGGNGAAPELLPRSMGLCAALPVRGRRRAGPLRGAPQRSRAATALAPLLGPGAGLCTVRCRTRDVDAGSDDRASGRTRGRGVELRRTPGSAPPRAAPHLPVRPRMPPAALPVGAHARASGAPDRSGAAPAPSWGRLSGPDASAPCLYCGKRGAEGPPHPEVSPGGTPRPVDEK